MLLYYNHTRKASNTNLLVPRHTLHPFHLLQLLDDLLQVLQVGHIDIQDPFEHSAVTAHIDALHIDLHRAGEHICLVVDHPDPIHTDNHDTAKQPCVDIS